MKQRTTGSIFMVAGIAIGAGILAMPLVTAGIGFTATLILFVLTSVLMCYTALLLVEVYQHQPAQTGFSTLARRYLGKGGLWLTSFSMLFLMYALTAAYISGAGELLAGGFQRISAQRCPSWLGMLIFTLIAGGLVCTGTRFIDLSNRILFSIKAIFLLLIPAVMIPHVEKENLMTFPQSQGLVLAAIPVILTSFGFHGSIPSIINYLGGNIRQLRQVFIIGSLIPLVTFIFWQWSILGAFSGDTFSTILAAGSGLDGLLQAVTHLLASPYVALTVHLFACLALVTSFLGVSLGLFDYLADLCRRENNFHGRLQTGALTFVPPLAVALLYPQGFIAALGFAGVALAILALFLPVLMVWKTRRLHQRHYQVWGGNPMLVLVLLCGMLIVVAQTGVAMGVWP